MQHSSYLEIHSDLSSIDVAHHNLGTDNSPTSSSLSSLEKLTCSMSFSSNVASSTATATATPATSFSESFDEGPLPPPDSFNIQRYIQAQDRNGIFDRVIEAIRSGGKIPRPTIAWIWFVFPQMDHCGTRRRPSRIVKLDRDVWPKGRAITGVEEARAILKHPILGPRMQKVALALLETRHADIYCAMDHRILDVQRVHSTMTIFREASRRPKCLHEAVEHGGTHAEFRMVLDKHFARAPDSDDEMTWGEAPHPVQKRSARHQPTLRALEINDVEVIEKRMASRNILCVCTNQKEELNRLDEEFMKKVRDKRLVRIQRG